MLVKGAPGLLHWHCDNHMNTPFPVGQPLWMCVNHSIMLLIVWIFSHIWYQDVMVWQKNKTKPMPPSPCCFIITASVYMEGLAGFWMISSVIFMTQCTERSIVFPWKYKSVFPWLERMILKVSHRVQFNEWVQILGIFSCIFSKNTKRRLENRLDPPLWTYVNRSKQRRYTPYLGQFVKVPQSERQTDYVHRRQSITDIYLHRPVRFLPWKCYRVH